MGSEASATVSSDGLTFQIGESNTDIISTKSIQANISGYSLNSLKTDVSAGANATISSDGKTVTANGFTRTMASAHMDRIDAAITQLNGYRGDIGSTQNQVESAVRNLMTQATNIKNAESVIRDVDYAEESANFNKLNIISQAGSYAISQSNAVSQNVLRLLQ
jgi:flagellin